MCFLHPFLSISSSTFNIFLSFFHLFHLLPTHPLHYSCVLFSFHASLSFSCVFFIFHMFPSSFSCSLCLPCVSVSFQCICQLWMWFIYFLMCFAHSWCGFACSNTFIIFLMCITYFSTCCLFLVCVCLFLLFSFILSWPASLAVALVAMVGLCSFRQVGDAVYFSSRCMACLQRGVPVAHPFRQVGWSVSIFPLPVLHFQLFHTQIFVSSPPSLQWDIVVAVATSSGSVEGCH